MAGEKRRRDDDEEVDGPEKQKSDKDSYQKATPKMSDEAGADDLGKAKLSPGSEESTKTSSFGRGLKRIAISLKGKRDKVRR